MSPIPVYELTVHPSTPMPPGYIFVSKGNVYITKNCRKLTHEASKSVYVVQADSKTKAKTTLGIRVPKSVHTKVLADNKATAATRAELVRRKDQALEVKTQKEVMNRYPNIPQEHVPRILKHTLQKKSRRIGRSREMPLSQVADLAVRAYIRHKLTEYDELLRKGVDREQARKAIQGDVDRIVRSWGGTAKSVATKSRRGKRDRKQIGKNTKTQKQARKVSPKVLSPRAQRARKATRAKERTEKASDKAADQPDHSRSKQTTKMIPLRPRRRSLRLDHGKGSKPDTAIVISDNDDADNSYREESMDIDSTDDSDASFRDDSD